ncbi:hypothetical protein IQ268_29680 [Oculatella sp. LEGE 06141]|uniref:hypothetical protein n=1 Tax=Oculatella sp. LEGE 06141 TaxID=1828648 RepID=UPI0018813037|nr:hypothetical protein [Oculatella sp. LEGE 06141]MBE9182711.1 hypothetical protein [Oculatella sp. LEGE 06141]
MLLSQIRSTLFCVVKGVNLNLTKRLFIGILGVLLIGSSGCASLPEWMNTVLSPTPVELTISQVEPAGRSGVYVVAGQTNLPNQTRLTVSAIRYLQDNAPRLSSEAAPIYSILDRQFAEVSNGRWKTNLNLWQVASDGQYQEAWQMGQAETGIQHESDSTVTFLATLDPPNQSAEVQNQIENQDTFIQATLVRYTIEGEPYLQASKPLNVALPTGSTTPPLTETFARAASGDRALSTPLSDTANPTLPDNWKQTNAPISPDEMFR